MNLSKIGFGNLKRRSLKLPDSKTIRPTSSIVKESIFNVLIHRFKIDFSKNICIDLFAGSGALGIESISLGCKNTIFIDQNLTSIKYINENIKSLNIENFSTVINRNAELIPDKLFLNFVNNYLDVLIFIDPPYKEKNLLLSQIKRFKDLFINKNLLIVIETNHNDIIKEFSNVLHTIKHGETIVIFM